MKEEIKTIGEEADKLLSARINRLSFLKYSGASVATAALVLTGCKDDDDMMTPDDPDAVDLGSSDTGILNYAYALEQLEAAFYIKVAESFYSGITPQETEILTDLREHEIAHRDFLKAALGSSAIPDLEVDFSTIDFTDRSSVLNTAKTFEDLGVAAYNGAGKLIADPVNLLLAGKIVSVEARHAAAIRDLLNPGSIDFAGNDVVDANGLDGAMSPADVLAAAAPYILTPIDASHLPTS